MRPVKPLPMAKLRYEIRQLGELMPLIRVECLAEYDATHHVRGVRHMASSLGSDGSLQLPHLLEEQRLHE